MSKHLTVIVPADPDQDDCLAAAAADYIAEHPELAGWDLEPRWADETRETVAMSVPEFVFWPIARELGKQYGENCASSDVAERKRTRWNLTENSTNTVELDLYELVRKDDELGALDDEGRQWAVVDALDAARDAWASEAE